jgi:coniferyl-aldehyde dehydrogenase
MNEHSYPKPMPEAGGDTLGTLLERQKQAYLSDMSPELAVRLDRLARLEAMIIDHQDAFCEAISMDFGRRDPIVSAITEVMTVRAAIRHARRHLKGWMKPRRVAVGWAFQPGKARILRQPLGVIGIVAPWNYPLQLLLSPLAGALAAGNRAMLKPSELTPAFSEILKAAVAKHFPPEEVAVVTGGPEVASAFSALPFDHLVFTGSTTIGRKVAEAAGRNLTPVTLELGGKSPTIVDESAEIATAAKRIAWGKLLNSGQTCVAPDYVLVHRSQETAFLTAFREAVKRQYKSFADNPDYTSIIAERHYARLGRLVEDARSKGAEIVALGENVDERRIFAPVLVLKPTADMLVMQEEIFGPILPIIPFDKVDEAIGHVNAHDRPLALYWFGIDQETQTRVLSRTISGGVTINDTILHLAQDGLPFGGVGPSGYGHYHGEYGFIAMSKEKPVFVQSKFASGGLLYPPYGAFARRMLRLLERFA